jgi:hypothetical protein
MSLELRQRLYDQLDALILIDPHTHIDALRPASATLADILGYHYYTELAHSAGMPKGEIEEPGLEPREKCRRLFENLGPIDNTIQYSWLLEMARVLFDWQEDRVTAENWESLYEAAEAKMALVEWPQLVLQASKLEKVFLTNSFDDPLTGFDTNVYVPCLRTDDLVFQQRVSMFVTRLHCGKLYRHYSSVFERLEPAPVRSRCRRPSIRNRFQRVEPRMRWRPCFAREATRTKPTCEPLPTSSSGPWPSTVPNSSSPST